MKSPGVAIVNHANHGRKRRGLSCLLWGFGAVACMLIGGGIVIGAVYGGWHSGLATARANSAAATQDEIQIQCERIPLDLAEGSLTLAQNRFEDLARLPQTPNCLPLWAPMATAARLAAASPTPPPTHTSAPTALPATAAPAMTATAPARIEEISAGFDLEALLQEAQAAIRLSDYASAIDTLDAIISIDEDFQRELVKPLFLKALTAQALALFRSGHLSEAIVMTDRAEELGSIDDLYHERFIALLYLDGQRYKATNPAEAVRKFSSMYYEFGVRDYVNGPIAGDLQESLRNYAMALALQGDHCPAQTQFKAALELQPAVGRVNRADMIARRDQSALACQAQQQDTALTAGAASEATPQSIGIREAATPAPVGYAG